MAAPRLASYVQQQKNAGYDLNTIRNYLIRNGYDSREVDAAIDFTHAPSKPAGKFPTLLVGIGALVILLIGITLFFTLGGDDEAPAQLLDLTTSTSDSELQPGDVIDFKIELINMGKSKRYDVSITHELINSIGNIIDTKQETMALETRASKSSELMIPEDASDGTYTLKTTAEYDEEKALSFFTVRVKGEAAEEDIPVDDEPEDEPIIDVDCPLSCDDYDQCTDDICNAATDYQCVNQAVVPCCGNQKCESGENYDTCPNDCEFVQETEPEEDTITTVRDVINKVSELAKDSPSQGASYCADISKENYKDSCYSTLAKESKDNSYCDAVVSESKRDNCYTNFALDGDYTVCDKIANKYLKQSCIALSQTV